MRHALVLHVVPQSPAFGLVLVPPYWIPTRYSHLLDSSSLLVGSRARVPQHIHLTKPFLDLGHGRIFCDVRRWADRGDVRRGRWVDRGDVRRGRHVNKGNIRRKRWADRGDIWWEDRGNVRRLGVKIIDLL